MSGSQPEDRGSSPLGGSHEGLAETRRPFSFSDRAAVEAALRTAERTLGPIDLLAPDR
jgi:hypothetical protein